jgi:general nucleoside transport system permease protein
VSATIARSGAGRRALLALAAPLIAIALALIAGGLMMLALGQSPVEIYALMMRESFGTGYGIGQTLFRATPLLFTGLSVALAFRAGLFNVGAEGQLYLGGFAAAMTGIALNAAPPALTLVFAVIAAALAGALWGGIPGALKARFGAHEVINTIMLNFIAFGLVSWLGHFVFQPATVRTASLAPGADLPRLDVLFPALRGAPANASLPLGLVVALLVQVLLFRTRLGYEMRAVGLNASAAEYGGIAIGRLQVTAMTLAGAVAGLGGVNFVLGYKHFFEMGFSSGAGFLGIAVALIGRNHPVGVALAALFFGALSYGGLVINQRVPKELVEVLQGLVILFAICAQAALERMARRWQ